MWNWIKRFLSECRGRIQLYDKPETGHDLSFHKRVPIQINGQFAEYAFMLPNDTAEEHKKLALSYLEPMLATRKVKDVIVIPGKLINIITD